MSSKAIKQIKQYARKRHIVIQDSKGITSDNLHDAKSLIKEFRSMAVQSGDELVCDIVGSPDTGLMLYLFWCVKYCMTYRQLQDSVYDAVKDDNLIADYEEELRNDMTDV
jgi:hypothetical protein